jgi:hypothetical protein
MGLQLGRQETIVLLSLEGVRRALETPQRRNEEDITRATFAAEANFPDTGTGVDYDAILRAVERMPARSLVMRRCLDHGGTRYARGVGRAGGGCGGWGCMRCPRAGGGRYGEGGHDGRCNAQGVAARLRKKNARSEDRTHDLRIG